MTKAKESSASSCVVIVRATALAGMEEAVVQAFLGSKRQLEHTEGCTMFDVHQDVDDPGQIVVIEEWPSRDHHIRVVSEVMAQPAFAAFRGMLAADLQFTYCAPR